MTLGARAGWALAVGLVIALVAVAAGAGRWLGDGRAGALVFDVSAPFPLASDARVLKAWDVRLRGREVAIAPTDRAEVVRVTVSGQPHEAEAVAATLTRTGTLQLTEVVEDTEVARRWYARVRGDATGEVAAEVDAWTDVRTGEQYADPYLRAPTVEALDQAVAALAATDPPPAGLVVRYERIEPQGSGERGAAREPYYRSYLVSAAPILDGSHVAQAKVSYEQNTLRPEVMVTFTADGRRRFAEATEAMVGRKLAIIVDGEVVSAPIVMSRIAGGVTTITMGGADARRQERDAAALAAALSARLELPAGLVAELRAVRPGAGGMPWLAPLVLGLLAGGLAFVGLGRLASVTGAAPTVVAPGSRGLWATLAAAGLTVLVPIAVILLGRSGFVLLPGVNEAAIVTSRSTGPFDPAFERVSLFALGLVPVVWGFWCVELAAALSRRWPQARRGTALERASLDRAAVAVGLLVAAVQAYSVAAYLGGLSGRGVELFTGGAAARWVVICTLVAAVAALVWLANLITRRGLCNGYLAFLGVGMAWTVLDRLSSSPSSTPFPLHRAALAASLAVVAVVTLLVTRLREADGARARQPWPVVAAVVGLGEAVGVVLLLVTIFVQVARVPLDLGWWSQWAVRPLWFDVGFATLALALVVRWQRLAVTRLALTTSAVVLVALFAVRWQAPPALGVALVMLPSIYLAFFVVEVVLALRARLGLAGAVAIVAVHDVERADRAADALAAAAIPASVEGLRLRAILRGLGGFAPIVIRVAAADAERASRVIADADAAADPALTTFAA